MDKKSMVFIVAVLAAAFLIGANYDRSVHDVIVAKQFVVVNDQRRVMARIDGALGGVMSFYDLDGHMRATLSIDTKDGTKISFYSEDRPRDRILMLGESSSGGGVIALHGRLAILGGKIAVRNKSVEDVVQISADENGNGVVGTYNGKGVGRRLTPGGLRASRGPK